MSKKYTIPKEYLGAFKAGHRPSAREFIDEEYSWELLKKIYKSDWKDQASIDALAFVTKFNNEFHKNVVDKNDALHKCECPRDEKTPFKHLKTCMRKDLNDRENARNRDISSVQKYDMDSYETNPNPSASASEVESDHYQEERMNSNRNLHNHEDTVIELLDLQNEQDSSDEH